MRKLVQVLFAILVLSSCVSTPRPGSVHNIAFDEIVRSYAGFSGHVIVADAASIIFNETYGEALNEVPVSLDDRWRWASVTKQLVAVAVLQMVEQGLVDLDSTIADVIPGSGVPNADGITIRHLLQHTSGLINDAELPDEAFVNGFDARSFCRGSVKNPPGQDFDYNNCDYVILGEVLEAVDGVSWFASLDQRVFAPSGVTGARPGLMDNGGETVAGYLAQGVPAPDVALELYEASGGVVGTASDLLRIDRALLSGRLLGKELRAEMWRSDPATGFAAMGQWVFDGQLRGCDSGVQLVERRGAISGIQTLNILAPEQGLSVIAFVNRDDFDWGAIWMRQGFAFDILSAAACRPE